MRQYSYLSQHQNRKSQRRQRLGKKPSNIQRASRRRLRLGRISTDRQPGQIFLREVTFWEPPTTSHQEVESWLSGKRMTPANNFSLKTVRVENYVVGQAAVVAWKELLWSNFTGSHNYRKCYYSICRQRLGYLGTSYNNTTGQTIKCAIKIEYDSNVDMSIHSGVRAIPDIFVYVGTGGLSALRRTSGKSLLVVDRVWRRRRDWRSWQVGLLLPPCSPLFPTVPLLPSRSSRDLRARKSPSSLSYAIPSDLSLNHKKASRTRPEERFIGDPQFCICTHCTYQPLGCSGAYRFTLAAPEITIWSGDSWSKPSVSKVKQARYSQVNSKKII